MGLFGEDTEQDKLVNQISARAPQEPLPKFPEVTGICRMCGNATIMRRQYEEVPAVFCSVFRDDRRIPLDIIECTSFYKRGGMSLRDMSEMAILIDERKQSGGQYL